MSSVLQNLSYFFRLPFHIQWRTCLVHLPRFVPLSVLHLTSPEGPQPFIIALPSRKNNTIPLYVFVPPKPVALPEEDGVRIPVENGEWKVPVVLDFHGGGFIMGSPLEQAPYAAMMSRELGAVVISVSYRIGPFHQFPAAIHDAEDVLSAILDTDQVTKAGKVLRQEIQRYFGMTVQDNKKKKKPDTGLDDIEKITLDASRLCVSGFSAGGNIALNMAIWVPPCPQLFSTPTAETRTPTLTRGMSPADTISPLLPPVRAPTVLDDICQPWPSPLPPEKAQPRMLPLLLFYPSLDARLLPHERPMKSLPSALNPDDKKPQTQRMPGLFSIMGPTYLPKKLRAHPRASPGLVDPKNVQKNAAILLVLPEKDSLAVQSDVWVDKMNSEGWNGPVRFGDGRDNDWNGHQGGASLTPSKKNGGMEVWHAPNCRHGWTQFPVAFLGKHEKEERMLVFERTMEFVKEKWAKTLPVEGQSNTDQEMPPLAIPPPMAGEGASSSSSSL
ncbi:alpha/beta-hydrolase [Bimuria novae-zelandiae CBS 107.79]|uniref:Alpha/beta-hydrolase n=1 Tax=Bimuria novae-zelandiae CBS 107.79 TaxID=1447943 RepID=A0A6A5VEF1_9PLEO|nr:alpha/beta-hydrolase [Bimuria novae-zelandiae CBS 107.79]